MKRFKATLATVKDYQRQALWLANLALDHFEKGTLFTNAAKELDKTGTVVHDVPGKYSFEAEYKGKKFHTRPRITQINSPGAGALAIVVRAGRNYTITFFCNKSVNENGIYKCEAYWKQGDESLGKAEYTLQPI